MFLRESEMAEFIGQVVDIFEDYLTEKNIDLYCEDREEALQEGDDGVAIIYGSLYDIVTDAIWYFKEENSSNEPLTELDRQILLNSFVHTVLDSYREILEQGRYEERLPNDDWNFLQEKVKETISNWDIYSFDKEDRGEER